MKMITKVLVGSRLHGLHTEKSDYDYRGIHIEPLEKHLSPFRKVKNTDWIEGDTDNTSYELAEFCKLATKGNATILEVFFSDQIIESTNVADEMRENWQKFMDTQNFINASRGYAQNQLNKMNLFLPDKRTPKFAVAYIRVLWQCAKFLEDGVFPCQIDSEDIGIDLYEVKNNWSDDMVIPLQQLFTNLNARVTLAHAKCEQEKRMIKPDIKWIEDFLLRTYLPISRRY